MFNIGVSGLAVVALCSLNRAANCGPVANVPCRIPFAICGYISVAAFGFIPVTILYLLAFTLSCFIHVAVLQITILYAVLSMLLFAVFYFFLQVCGLVLSVALFILLSAVLLSLPAVYSYCHVHAAVFSYSELFA